MADFPIYSAEDDRPIVYVRSVLTEELPDEAREQAGDAEQIYAIHDQSGAVLALVEDRARAFQIARMNEMAPVSVH